MTHQCDKQAAQKKRITVEQVNSMTLHITVSKQGSCPEQGHFGEGICNSPGRKGRTALVLLLLGKSLRRKTP